MGILEDPPTKNEIDAIQVKRERLKSPTGPTQADRDEAIAWRKKNPGFSYSLEEIMAMLAARKLP